MQPQVSKIRARATQAPLSQLFTDPLVVDAFRRAERDGDTFAIVPVCPITLAGGAAETMEATYA